MIGQSGTVNVAAEHLVRTSASSFKAVADHTLELQKRNAQFAWKIFTDWPEWVCREAESNGTAVPELLERFNEQADAYWKFSGELAKAYIDALFLPPFSVPLYDWRSPSPNTYTDSMDGALPIEGYDELTVEEISKEAEKLSAREVEVVRSYEKRHKNRQTLLEHLDRSLV